ncbi:MAG TPA: cysteine synthase A [Sphingomicrobium sp.]|jgi:cysteine synthase A|nr:cysteine synthase A [Sphingomicrobium sp.]
MQDRETVLDAIGNTPLIKLRRASEETGCTILGKAEFMNPGQSVKDRAALGIVCDAIGDGRLRPGGIIVDGTAGNTGIGLTVVGNALGMRTVIVIPETQTEEKKSALRFLGATLIEVPAVPYKNPNNYVKVAARIAERLNNEDPDGAIFAAQFDNIANRDAHVRSTGPEIWEQTDGKIDAFVSAVGTGGTLAGVAIALRERNPNVTIALADVPGAALFNYYTNGELRSEGSSITEGIGQGRITGNLEGLTVDEAFLIPDQETLRTLYGLIEDEGLALGTSSGVNVAGAIRLAKRLGPGKTIVTMLCDPATRYQSRLADRDFLRSKGLPVAPWLDQPIEVEADFIAEQPATQAGEDPE